MWFVYEMTPIGYRPHLYAEKPDAKTSEGRRRKFKRPPALVPENLRGMNLDFIASFMGAKDAG